MGFNSLSLLVPLLLFPPPSQNLLLKELGALPGVGAGSPLHTIVTPQASYHVPPPTACSLLLANTEECSEHAHHAISVPQFHLEASSIWRLPFLSATSVHHFWFLPVMPVPPLHPSFSPSQSGCLHEVPQVAEKFTLLMSFPDWSPLPRLLRKYHVVQEVETPPTASAHTPPAQPRQMLCDCFWTHARRTSCPPLLMHLGLHAVVSPVLPWVAQAPWKDVWAVMGRASWMTGPSPRALLASPHRISWRLMPSCSDFCPLIVASMLGLLSQCPSSVLTLLLLLFLHTMTEAWCMPQSTVTPVGQRDRGWIGCVWQWIAAFARHPLLIASVGRAVGPNGQLFSGGLCWQQAWEEHEPAPQSPCDILLTLSPLLKTGLVVL